MDQEAQAIRSMEALVSAMWPGAEPAGPAPERAAATDDLSDDPWCLGESVAVAQLELLDRINLAAAVLNREGRIVGLNRRCDRVFGSGLMRQCGRLVAKDRASNERLRQAIREAISCHGRPQAAACRGFIRREPGAPILFRALPLELSPLTAGPRYALLLFSASHLQPAPDARLLARAFGLTPAQARVACQVATGASLDAAAARLGVKKETVRNHLKQIFLRTGTCRQGELVALLSHFWIAAQEEGQPAGE